MGAEERRALFINVKKTLSPILIEFFENELNEILNSRTPDNPIREAPFDPTEWDTVSF